MRWTDWIHVLENILDYIGLLGDVHTAFDQRPFVAESTELSKSAILGQWQPSRMRLDCRLSGISEKASEKKGTAGEVFKIDQAFASPIALVTKLGIALTIHPPPV